MNEPADYLERARAYWRFAPGGTGKVDGAELLAMPDDSFLGWWHEEKRVRRLLNWEEADFIRYFSEQAAGKDVFSFGCGLAYSELEFLDAGARVTFADIVPTSVACVERLCRLTGHGDRTTFITMGDSADTDFGGPYDMFFAYGSLMHMPAGRQQRVLANMARALRPGGTIRLMLYTPAFVEALGSSFDHSEFGRASDPDVGNLGNPWSDWHDDEKLQRLAGPDLRILQRETYHEDRFVWYTLGRSVDHAETPIRPIVDLPRIERERFEAHTRRGTVAHELTPAAGVPADAIVTREPSGGARVATTVNQFHYALTFPRLSSPPGLVPNRLIVDADVEAGGFSISLLDVYANLIFYTASFNRTGAIRTSRDVSQAGWPAAYRVVVANYCPAGPAPSTFALHRLALLHVDDER